MKEIYELRQQGKNWKEITAMLTVPITRTCLHQRFKRWCEANNMPLKDGRIGNKKTGRPKKEIKIK